MVAVFLSTVELLLWDTSIQGIPPFREHKIWSQKNVHTMFVYKFVTSGDGTPLFRGKRHLFWVVSAEFNLHSGDTLAIKKWLSTNINDKFNCPPVTTETAFKTWINSLKSDVLHLGKFNTQHRRDHYLAAWNNDSLKCHASPPLSADSVARESRCLFQ